MTECAECLRYGYSRTKQVAYPCALCGELRCEDHAIWVPAHEIDRPFDVNKELLKLIGKDARQGGWYCFCGRPSHVPRGVPYRAGSGKEGGKIVTPILEHEKKPGLEMFRMWETGLIEEGYEKTWDVKNYALSCSIATIMVLVATLHATQGTKTGFLDTIYNTAISPIGEKKDTFFVPSKKEFEIAINKNPEMSVLVDFVCSRCAVIPCLNRQAPFYDQKMFKRLAKAPEELFAESEV
ncbi:MAG: hypothetical protein ACFFCX_09930 [Candidatus Sifarchaeia archaeon]